MDFLMGTHQTSAMGAIPGEPAMAAHSEFAMAERSERALDGGCEQQSQGVPATSGDARYWYAVYTCANRERRVAEQFVARGIEHFLPLYESVRKWQDRRVRLKLPLFPGYVFVSLALRNRLAVLQVPGVAHLVGFDGRPAAVPEVDVMRVREFLSRGFRAEPCRLLKAGRRVRVKAGPLAGMEGIVARRKNGNRLVISFALIQQAIAVEVSGEELEAL
jgi:transcription antitermination factor NusG